MLHAGLIGFPSSGKTTLFELLTNVRDPSRSQGKSDANIGVARVPDVRLDQLTGMFNPKKKVPATVEFADMAAGARAGAAALVDVVAYRTANALLHVVRAFRDASVPHPRETVDPVRDVRAIEDELVLADLGLAERRLDRLERDLKKSGTPELKKEQDVLIRCRAALESGTPLRALGLDREDAKRLSGFQFLSAKPLLVVVNLDESDMSRAQAVVADLGLTALAAGLGAGLVPVCAKLELEIAQLDAADAATFLADLGLTESGLDRVIRATYELLGYMSFFTVGEDECRAWSIPRGTPAQLAAGEIHSDIARGFIRAEVVSCARLLERGSLTACRAHAELRLEGKEYIVGDGDVITFRHAT